VRARFFTYVRVTKARFPSHLHFARHVRAAERNSDTSLRVRRDKHNGTTRSAWIDSTIREETEIEKSSWLEKSVGTGLQETENVSQAVAAHRD